MSKRKVDFDDYEPVKRSHKKKVTKEYRWYGANSSGMMSVFDGSAPPTLTYDREVSDGNTEDVNYSLSRIWMLSKLISIRPTMTFWTSLELMYRKVSFSVGLFLTQTKRNLRNGLLAFPRNATLLMLKRTETTNHEA